MKATGKIIEISGNNAIVECVRSSACSSCHNCEARGACHAELVFGGDRELVHVCADNSVGAKDGDSVELESSTGKTLLISFMTFIFPFIMSVLSFFVFSNYIMDMTILASIFVAVFVVSFFIVIKIMNLYAKNNISFKIVKVIKERE